MITIVVTTYFEDEQRKGEAEAALFSWHKFIKYDEDINLHIADDGSKLKEYLPMNGAWNRGTVSFSRQERKGVGASLNTGFRKAFESSPYVLYAVDDWKLNQELDLTPWIQLLEQDISIGMVRLGPPHPYIRGNVELTQMGWALRLDRYSFFFGHRPAIYHKRLIDTYGEFKEGVSALECEQEYLNRMVNDTRLDVVYALPVSWEHIGSKSLSEIQPA